ncbi:papain-like cysteine protease family protein [Pseudomonas sp. P9_31]|uniref:papain-like cysteine protease family protein n=1 Tax=Pseudomonas sp. P9_31 TaxID=3043448 RepID=UPI002A359D29|nr:papain-like cysteine protease family protein [Pseudomonas sp. P9_31]WPN55997.1 papain-like cysteine protease family protein [Pseudomonas sp. P9_31]
MITRASIFSLCIFFTTNASAIEQQEYDNWCWAASVQDVVAQTGYYERQSQVVARLTGWPQNRPARIDELVFLVRSYGLRAWQAGRPGSPQELYNTLMSGWKLIAFVTPTNGPVGHYIVLQGIDPAGNIIVSDPANGYTGPNTPAQLYYGWRWADSIVVGR